MEHKKGADFSQPTQMEPDSVDTKSDIAKREEEILHFWKKERIFEKTLEKPAPKGEFVFYDGPPFATGLPHHGHILAGTIKDTIPRYRTMQGYHVNRRWGWDCHGLPLENIIEKELGIKNKREIEEMGIDVFNEAARKAVLRYADDWKKIIPRMGRWADMDHDYKTMDTTYSESVWWVFRNLFDRGLIYEGFKSMHLCPRCGTTLSNFEVAQGYTDIEDISIYVKLPIEGMEKTSLLVWTTTPWTMPGNAAAAVHKDAVYVKVDVGGEYVIVAKERLEVIQGEPKIVAEMKGAELVGKKYDPPFSYFKNKSDLKGRNKGWKIYHAPYVSMENGTGAVHLAPAFGDVDLELAQKEGIPVIHHVSTDGLFTSEVADFAGLLVKKKGAHQDTDKKIVEYLEKQGRLYKHDTIVHSYPHCWRCDTPLLVYASSSWFVNIQKLKSKLAKENKKIGWVPSVIGEKRFQNMLETAPDWAISRARYWGAPLPVWKNSKTGKIKVVGSTEELLASAKRSGNTYIVMRHGEARSNVENFVDSGTVLDNHLTQNGKSQVVASAAQLKSRGVDLIVASPILRAQETAKIVLKELNLPDSCLMTDERLHEIDFGTFSGEAREKWISRFSSYFERYNKKIDDIETLSDVRKRVGDFMFDIERRYIGKKILIVTHAEPGWLIEKIAGCVPCEQIARREKPYHEQEAYLGNAAFREVAFIPYPHNPQFDLDLHRPYIDEITWGDPIEGQWKRIPDVFDCWFESGSMPYASNHYPFANKHTFNPKRMLGLAPKGYPADFIAESVDQTRGWFYSMLVLGTALFGRSPYKHVITNGLVLAQDGKKMSKKLKNYTDPSLIADSFGADALRYYLLSSPLIRGEDLNFTDRGVDEIAKKLIMRLENVRTFFALYNNDTPVWDGLLPQGGTEKVRYVRSPLDIWILSRLQEVIAEVTAGFEVYELDVAARPIAGFIDDLSTWYLRRCRDRFKGELDVDGTVVRATLRLVLRDLSRVMAPMMPFYADYLYRYVREENDPESVHLASWPLGGEINTPLIEHMKVVREIVSEGLDARAKANIKVRQPLSRITISGRVLSEGEEQEQLKALIRDELNVKEVHIENGGEVGVQLDTTITPELKEEGMLRDMMRLIQAFRKESGMSVSDRPSLVIATNTEGKTAISKMIEKLTQETGLMSVRIEDASADAQSHKDLGFPVEVTVIK